jgi:hypothetical protein
LEERLPTGLHDDEPLAMERHQALAAWSDVLHGARPFTLRRPHPAAPPAGPLLVPGSFRPLHDGHRALARLAAQLTGATAHFELSITNVEKPPLDYLEIAARLAQFHDDEPVLLTRAATFLDKARLFPGCTFAVGVDTVLRLGDPRFYADADAAARALATLARLDARFLVFGRRIDDRFLTLDDCPLDPAVRTLCRGVAADQFRLDLSSTELRRRPDG